MKVNLEDLTIEEKVGQMLMVGMDTNDAIDKIEDLILKYKIGGILLYKKNFRSYEELIDLVNYIKTINKANKVPMFIAIDQEGGRVNRMPKEFANVPSASSLAIARENNKDIVRQAGFVTGMMLKNVGINFDFAPVLDIKRFADNQAIGDRAYSEDIKTVTQCGIEFMQELQKQNIVSVVKHFPGHGATTKDSHFILPVIKEDISKLQKEDMKPFEKVIANGADAVLVSHLNIKNVTGRYPASMSKEFIRKYLREQYNYKGLIVTDDMRMKGVRILYGKNRPIKKAFEAGNDIVVFKYSSEDKVIKKIVENVKNDKIDENMINESVSRILETKNKYNFDNDIIEKNLNFIEEVNKQILNIRNECDKRRKD